MLKYMRSHATSWFIKILLGLIIVVFVLWGMGRIKNKEKTVVATIGRQSITKAEFDRMYQNLLAYYTRLFGQQVSPDLLKGLNIRQQALDQLIDAAVIGLGAQRIGLRVTEAEVRDAILQFPAFQRDGKFDRYLYEQFSRNMGLDSEKLQAMIQTDLINQRMMTFIGDTGVILTEEEAQELYLLENETINLDFVKVVPKAFRGRVTVTQSDLDGYYAEHKEEFRTPSRVKVLYLRFSPDAYLKEAAVSPQEIQEYYDMNIEQYQSPERVRVRHILIAVSPEAGPDVVEEARKKAEKVLAEARRGAQGANFAALARTYSDDPSSAGGGDLGYFSRGEMDPALGEVVFSLRKGEIGPVVRTRHGFHVVKVEDRQEGKTRGLEEVKEEIVGYLKKEKAKELAAIHAEDAAYQAKTKDGLQSYAAEKGLQVREEGPFRAGMPLKGLGLREKFSSIAFTLDENEVSSAFQDEEDYFVLQVVEKIPPLVPPLEEVRGHVQEALVASSAQRLAQSIARDLLMAWKKGEGFSDLLRANGLQVEATGFFKRSASSLPRIGTLAAHADELAALTRAVPWPEDIIEVSDAYVVIKLRDIKKVDDKVYEKEKDTYHKQLSGLKGRELLQGWVTAMKDEVDIKINQDLSGQYR